MLMPPISFPCDTILYFEEELAQEKRNEMKLPHKVGYHTIDQIHDIHPCE